MTENNQNVKVCILNRINIFDKLEEAEKRHTRTYDPEIKKIKVYGVFAKETYDNIFLFHAGDVIKYLKGATKNKKWFIKNFRQPVELIQINILVPFDNHTKPLKCNLLNMCGVLRAIYLCGRESKTDIKTKNGTELSNFMSESIMMGTLTDSFNIYNYFNNNFDPILREYIYPDKTLDNLSIEMDSNDIEEEIKELEMAEKIGGYVIKESNTNHIKVKKTDDATQNILDLPVENPIEPNLKVENPIEPNLKVENPIEPNLKVENPIEPNLKVENPIEPNLKVIECNNISEKDLHKQFSALLFSVVGLVLLMGL
jgi:hypothetical protein